MVVSRGLEMGVDVTSLSFHFVTLIKYLEIARHSFDKNLLSCLKFLLLLLALGLRIFCCWIGSKRWM